MRTISAILMLQLLALLIHHMKVNTGRIGSYELD